MVRMALVRTSDGYVDNIIICDPAGDYQPPEGYDLVDAEGVQVSPGDQYVNGVFVPGRSEGLVIPPNAERDDILARLAALEEAMKQLKPEWKPPDPPARGQV